jgi:hypothetical protein
VTPGKIILDPKGMFVPVITSSVGRTWATIYILISTGLVTRRNTDSNTGLNLCGGAVVLSRIIESVYN